MLAFAVPENAANMTVLLINLKTFKTVIQYNIIPDTSFTANQINLISNQTVQVDFANQRVVFPIQSNDKEPYKSGFFYLRIEATWIQQCMTTPPIGTCNSTSIQNVKLYSNVYKHWEEVGQPRSTTPSE